MRRAGIRQHNAGAHIARAWRSGGALKHACAWRTPSARVQHHIGSRAVSRISRVAVSRKRAIRQKDINAWAVTDIRWAWRAFCRVISYDGSKPAETIMFRGPDKTSLYLSRAQHLARTFSSICLAALSPYLGNWTVKCRYPARNIISAWASEMA